MTAGFEVNEPRAVAYEALRAAELAADKARQVAYDFAYETFRRAVTRTLRDDELDNDLYPALGRDHDER
jgi:hypothetical protein